MAHQPRRVGLRELRLNTRHVVERVADEGTIEITDRGTVIAILTTPPAAGDPPRPPGITRALRLLDQHRPTDTGAHDQLMADKLADLELADS